LAKQICFRVPTSSSSGLSMFGALEAGEETAVKFWDDHVEEVKNVVPRDKLLIWEVCTVYLLKAGHYMFHTLKVLDIFTYIDKHL